MAQIASCCQACQMAGRTPQQAAAFHQARVGQMRPFVPAGRRAPAKSWYTANLWLSVILVAVLVVALLAACGLSAWLLLS